MTIVIVMMLIVNDGGVDGDDDGNDDGCDNGDDDGNVEVMKV